MDYALLKGEIVATPALRLLADAGRDAEVADALNAVQQNIAVSRCVIPSYEIVAGIVPAEWAALTAAERDRLMFIVAAGQVDTQSANVRAAFTGAFGPASATRANLVALLTRPGSRAEQLFGQQVTAADVAIALRGGV